MVRAMRSQPAKKLFSDDWELIQFILLDSDTPRQRIHLPAHVQISLIISILYIEPQNRSRESPITNSFASFLWTSKLYNHLNPVTREDVLPISPKFYELAFPVG